MELSSKIRTLPFNQELRDQHFFLTCVVCGLPLVVTRFMNDDPLPKVNMLNHGSIVYTSRHFLERLSTLSKKAIGKSQGSTKHFMQQFLYGHIE